MVGPFAVRDGEDNYQLYLIRPPPVLSLISSTCCLTAPAAAHRHHVNQLTAAAMAGVELARPARKLKHAADEVASGNLRQHPELESGPQEFLAAGSSFNQMVSALERMMTAQQRLLSDISHELRTPLTRLQLATALLRRRHGEGKSWSVLRPKRSVWTA